jgi:hypothetical protein
MKCFKITSKLRRAIKNSKYSMRRMSKFLNFEIKNLMRNKSKKQQSQKQKLHKNLYL